MEDRIVIYGHADEICGHEIFKSNAEAKAWIGGFYSGASAYAGDEAWACTGGKGDIDFHDDKFNAEVSDYVKTVLAKEKQ